MPISSFRLNSRGIRQVLRSEEVRLAVTAAAESIADRVREQVPPDAPVVVDEYTTDRGAAAVVITDVRAMIWQARNGVLTRAAGAAGYEVRRRGGG